MERITDSYSYCKVWGAGKKHRESGKEEVKLLKDYIFDAKNILDLGCGIGRSSINFYKKLSLKTCMFYLADYYSMDWKKNIEGIRKQAKQKGSDTFGYHKDNKPFYTASKDIIESYCKDNGLINFEIVDMSSNRIQGLKDIDLVYSFHSVGYHFPIGENVKKFDLLNVTVPDALFIFGVNRWKFKTDNFREVDGLVLIDDIGGKYHQDFLVFEGKNGGKKCLDMV